MKKLPKGFPWMGTFGIPCVAVIRGDNGEWRCIAFAKTVTEEAIRARMFANLEAKVGYAL